MVAGAGEADDGEARARANARRAEEAVIAAFMAKYSVPGEAPELPPPGEGGAVEVSLDMTSISLLTPDTMRHLLKRGSNKDERGMLIDQTTAWEAVERSGVEFSFGGQTIRVKPRIHKFNFGVNEGAVNFGRIAPNKAGGWDISDKMNGSAFAALEKEAEEFIERNRDVAGSAPKVAAVRTLLRQCRDVLSRKSERSDAHDAYKAAARIAVLSRLVGNVPCWNCKSGKDRTGEMDVECKFLSTLIARGEQIPEPGGKLTGEQQALFRAIAIQGGNFEVQKMNVGIAGFKTGGVESISERLGGRQYREYHRGGSDHVLG